MFFDRVILLVCAASWASVVPLMSRLLEKYDPFLLSVARNVFGAAVLVAVAISFDRSRPLRWRGHPQHLFWLGCSLATFSLLYISGMASVDIITAAALVGCQPVAAALTAAVLDDRRITVTLWGAVLAASFGGLLVASTPGTLTCCQHLGGSLLICGSLVAWAWYSIMAQRWLGGASQLRVTAITFTASAAIQIAVLAGIGWAGLIPFPGAPDWRDGALLGGAVIAGVVIGPWLWNIGVQRVGIVLASLHMNLVPVFGIALAAAAFGDWPTWSQLAGTGLILVGITCSLPEPTPLAPATNG